MASKNLRPAAILAGAAVVGGVILFASSKRKSCRELPGIWSEEGPLHITPSAQEEAFELARIKIREYVLSDSDYTVSSIVMAVADGIRECEWEKLETDQQKQVWKGLEQIVKSEIESYKYDSEAWLKEV